MTPYLKKSALFPAQIFGTPHPDLNIIVVIPAYREKELLTSLQSLANCDAPRCAVEIIVVLNDSEEDNKTAKKENQRMYQQACKWGLTHSSAVLKFHILYHTNLPVKHAGVGLARKIGLDEAVYRFAQIKNQKGILSCYDADSSCDKNYLVALEKHFLQRPELQGCSIYFEHPIKGDEFDEDVYQAIIQYELHLRYYIHAQRFAGFPYAFQTIGSSMAVRADAYQQQGGMNRRKAGEDFYFLHKFISLGHFNELRSTRVIPSPRISKRVPFGTGRAIGTLVQSQEPLTTYAPQSFVDLKAFFEKSADFFNIESVPLIALTSGFSDAVQEFLIMIKFSEKLEEINGNTTNLKNFEQRFYRWFNAFMLMKYLHFCRDNFYDNEPVDSAARWLLKEYHQQAVTNRHQPANLLKRFRRLDQDKKRP